MTTEENSQIQTEINLLVGLLNEVTRIQGITPEQTQDECEEWYWKGRTTGGLEVKNRVTRMLSERITYLTNKINTRV